MLNTISLTLTLLLLVACSGSGSEAPTQTGRYEVYGVDAGDMLKLRSGPGIGYNVIVGLPNTTVLQVYDCQSTGGTRWCSVSLQNAPKTKGHVSQAYLRKIKVAA